jgi:hypothetical protein
MILESSISTTAHTVGSEMLGTSSLNTGKNQPQYSQVKGYKAFLH